MTEQDSFDKLISDDAVADKDFMDLQTLGEGDVAYIRRAMKGDVALMGDWPYLAFSASGTLLAGFEDLDQGFDHVIQAGLVPVWVN